MMQHNCLFLMDKLVYPCQVDNNFVVQQDAGLQGQASRPAPKLYVDEDVVYDIRD